jgi:hypothetical protein
MSPVADLYHKNFTLAIIDFIHDAISTLPDPISFLTGQLLTIRRPRVLGKDSEAFQNTSYISFRNATKIIGN